MIHTLRDKDNKIKCIRYFVILDGELTNRLLNSLFFIWLSDWFSPRGQFSAASSNASTHHHHRFTILVSRKSRSIQIHPFIIIYVQLPQRLSIHRFDAIDIFLFVFEMYANGVWMWSCIEGISQRAIWLRFECMEQAHLLVKFTHTHTLSHYGLTLYMVFMS